MFLIKIFILIKDLLTFNGPYFEMYINTYFRMRFMIISYINYLLFIINVSFLF